MSLHSIQTKIMTVSLLIAVGTAVASLIISFYAEINTIKSTTERYTDCLLYTSRKTASLSVRLWRMALRII